MLTALRQWLQSFDYYAAKRETTPWTRIADLWLIGAIPIAFIAVLACDYTVSHPGESELIDVAVDGSIIGRLQSAIAPRDALLDTIHPETTGTLHIWIDKSYMGWPLATTIVKEQPVADLTTSGCSITRVATKHENTAATDVVIDAIDDAGRSDVADHWKTGLRQAQSRPAAWVGGTILWWCMLVMGGLVILRIAQFGLRVVHVHQWRRSKARMSAGLCPVCGYNLTGLEFSSRCPECGEET